MNNSPILQNISSGTQADKMSSLSSMMDTYQTLNMLYQHRGPQALSQAGALQNYATLLTAAQNEVAIQARLQAVLSQQPALQVPSTSDAALLALLRQPNTTPATMKSTCDLISLKDGPDGHSSKALLSQLRDLGDIPSPTMEKPVLKGVKENLQGLLSVAGQHIIPIPSGLLPKAPEHVNKSNDSDVGLLALIKNAQRSRDMSTSAFNKLSSNAPCLSTLNSAVATTGRQRCFPIMEPQAIDVLFGKGRTKHRGNSQLQKTTESLMAVYEAATKQQKKELADMVVSKVLSSGGRFLKLDEETQRWDEVSKEDAHKKVAHAFRNLRRRSK